MLPKHFITYRLALSEKTELRKWQSALICPVKGS